MENRVVHSFKRNETEEVRIAVGAYKDKTYLDVRVYFRMEKDSEWAPTKKGITIPAELISNLAEGLRLAKAELGLMANA